MKCLFCLSAQCVHVGSGQLKYHEDPIPDAITIHGGEAYCRDCIKPYALTIGRQVARGQLTAMRPYNTQTPGRDSSSHPVHAHTANSDPVSGDCSNATRP